jgi:hypothetical protein
MYTSHFLNAPRHMSHLRRFITLLPQFNFLPIMRFCHFSRIYCWICLRNLAFEPYSLCLRSSQRFLATPKEELSFSAITRTIFSAWQICTSTSMVSNKFSSHDRVSLLNRDHFHTTEANSWLNSKPEVHRSNTRIFLAGNIMSSKW